MRATRTNGTTSMASPRPKGPRPISLAAQRGRLAARYPDGQTWLTPTRLVWKGRLTPTDYSATYELVVDHQRAKDPIVYVAKPRLRLVGSKPLEHVYSWNTLCLFLGHRQWHPGTPIADALIPWATEWLLFYEVWLATDGQWHGNGVHPPDIPPNRLERRRQQQDREAKLKRLRGALRIAYGSDPNLDELLYNARLTPATAKPAEAA